MKPTIRGNLIALAGASAIDWQSEVTRTLQQQNLSVFNNQNPIFDIMSQETEINNEVYFTKSYCQILIGVLLPNFPSSVSCQLLLEYSQFFRHNCILVIPDYNNNSQKDTLEFNHQKDVNRQRTYLRETALNLGAKIFDTIEEATEYAITLSVKWGNTVGTFGACGKTTWRSEYFSPMTLNMNHFNPQQEVWRPEMMIEEQEAKQYCNVLYLNLNDVPLEQVTLGLVSQDETWFLSTEPRNIIIVYNPELDKNAMTLLEEKHQEDYSEARMQIATKLEIAKNVNPYLKWVRTVEEGMEALQEIQKQMKTAQKVFALTA